MASIQKVIEEINKSLAAGLSYNIDGSIVTELTGYTGFDGGEGMSLSSPKGQKGGKMRVEMCFEYNPTGSWQNVNPYTIAFVYPKNGEPFIVKGGYKDVEAYLNKYELPAIVHFTLWHKMISRSIIKTINCGKTQIVKVGSGRNMMWEVSVAQTGFTPYKVIARMKKLPRKWIKELDNFVCDKSDEEKKNFRRIVL